MVKKKSKLEINNDTILRRDPEQEFTYIDGEVVMLSLKNGEYYGLDEVGTVIWELLEEPIRFDKLIHSLIKKYNVSKKVCEEDTISYLVDLLGKQLVKL